MEDDGDSRVSTLLVLSSCFVRLGRSPSSVLPASHGGPANQYCASFGNCVVEREFDFATQWGTYNFLIISLNVGILKIELYSSTISKLNVLYIHYVQS